MAKTHAMHILLERIAIDPQICGGRLCVTGTRIWVSLILELLADRLSEADVRAECPALAREDIRAAIAYGAEVSRERIVSMQLVPVP